MSGRATGATADLAQSMLQQEPVASERGSATFSESLRAGPLCGWKLEKLCRDWNTCVPIRREQLRVGCRTWEQIEDARVQRATGRLSTNSQGYKTGKDKGLETARDGARAGLVLGER